MIANKTTVNKRPDDTESNNNRSPYDSTATISFFVLSFIGFVDITTFVSTINSSRSIQFVI